MGAGNVVDQLRRGTQAFLDACLEPATQRVVLLEAPTILGWDTWREIDAKYGLGLIRAVLQQAVDEGALEPQPVEPLAHMLLGAMNEAALLIATAKNVKRARAEVGTSLERLIAALTRR
jgi:hypothetical protein